MASIGRFGITRGLIRCSAGFTVAGVLGSAGVAHGQLYEMAKLYASDGAGGDYYGASVGLDDNLAIAGARHDSPSGSAYVHRFTGDSWLQEAKLLPFDGGVDDWFGAAVDVSGEFAIVGAPFDDDFGSASGSAYVFVHDGESWDGGGKLLPADGAAAAEFGAAVAIDGEVAIVGAPFAPYQEHFPGAAYIFRYVGSARAQEARLVPDVVDIYVREFGRSVAVSGDVAVVGAPEYDIEIGPEQWLFSVGAAYVFRYDGNAWNQEAMLMASDFGEEDRFGISVAIDGDVIVVGAGVGADPFGSGSAYVYRFNGESWVQEIKLHVPAGGAELDMSTAVDVHDDMLVAGAYVIDLGSGSIRCAAVYEYNGWSWNRTSTIVPADSEGNFGSALAIDSGFVLAGSYNDHGATAGSGAAYIFNLAAANCPADVTFDATVDVLDLLAVIAAWGPWGYPEDINGDGTVDVLDLLAVIAAWGPCP